MIGKLLAMFLASLFVLIGYSFLIIWALNTLFKLNLQYEWEVIAATLVLLLALPGQIPPFKK